MTQSLVGLIKKAHVIVGARGAYVIVSNYTRRVLQLVITTCQKNGEEVAPGGGLGRGWHLGDSGPSLGHNTHAAGEAPSSLLSGWGEALGALQSQDLGVGSLGGKVGGGRKSSLGHC